MTVQILGRRYPATATYVVALTTSLLLLVLTVTAAFMQASVTAGLNAEVRESSARRTSYRSILQRLTDAETAQRGYLLTSDAEYLDPLIGAQRDVEANLALLEESARPGERDSLARISELARRKLDELQLTIDLQRGGRRAEASMILRSGRGREVMEELRDITEQVLAREDATLFATLDANDAASVRLRWVVVIAGLLILGVGALLVIAARNALREMRASRDEARDAHAQLSAQMQAREEAESKVRQMQKMEAIGQITGGVAHDFNNMLAVIMSALQLARRRLETDKAGAETFIEAAQDGARRAATLTSRLLAFARRKPLSPSVLEVNRVLSDMSELLRRTLGESIALETVLAGGLWRVNADPNELEQAILNVCVNARDAMPDGGKLTIESANTFLDEAYASANVDVSAGQYVMVAITDTGAGMPADVRQKAFEPFFTTKDVGKGTGLGLSQVHGFLKQSGGHAAIYSEPGHGTTVKLYLPRTHLAESAAEGPASSESENPHGDAGTIVLVVEDEDRVRTLSVASLRELGYTVLHASGGPKALEVLEANPGVTLLFTDVVMPAMSGKVLADEARKRHAGLKVLYTTGYTQNAIVHNGVLDADARLLLKPYTLSELARKVRAVLDE